jgi:regulator of sigma E protease
MDLILTAVIFIVLVGLLVFIHELAHFLVAKKAGVITDEFALGFGPKIFSKKWHGTEYKLNLIPLGGYVKMLGDQDASSFMRYTAKKYSSDDRDYALKLLKENKIDPKTVAYPDIVKFYEDQEKKLSAEDYLKLQNYFTKDYIPNHPGNFDNKRIRVRLAIVVAGVVMNFLLGMLLFYVYFQFTGYTSDLVKIGNPNFLGAQTSSPPVLFKIYDKNLSQYEGSFILEANGARVVSEDAFDKLVTDSYNKPINLLLFSPTGYATVNLELNGDGVLTNFDTDVKDKVGIISTTEDSAAAKAGITAGEVVLKIDSTQITSVDNVLQLLQQNKGKTVEFNIIDNDGQTKKVSVELPNPESGPILGATLGTFGGYYNGAVRVSYQNNKLLSGLLHGINMTTYSIGALGSLVGESIRQRNIQPVSQSVTSILGVADIIHSLVKARDFINILNLAGLISITLAFMNLLPVPLFDGGNALFLILEKLRGKPLSAELQERIGKYTFILLVIVIILVVIKDVVQFEWVPRLVNFLRNLLPR